MNSTSFNEDMVDTKELFEILENEINSYEELGINENVTFKSENSNSKESFQCQVCSESFNALELYEAHKYIHSPVSDCPLCNRPYKSSKPFYNHIEDHLKNYMKCGYCDKIFFKKMSLLCHVSEHKKLEKSFRCSYCEKNFHNKRLVTNHERVHTNERPFKCDKCNKTFKQSSALKTHLNTHMEEKLYTCQVCGGTFATTSSLKRHQKNIHMSGRSILCKLCEEKFHNLDSFFRHRMEKHPNADRFFRICHICNEEFISKHCYTLHRKMHKKNGELDDINVMVEPIEDEKDEQENKSNPKNSKKRRCFLCGMLVDIDQYYIHKNEHLDMTLEEVVESQTTMKFECKRCDIVTISKQQALYHMDKHMEKIYFCSVVDCLRKQPMTYFQNRNHQYNNHQTLKCRSCNLTFKGYFSFNRHRKSCRTTINCSSTKKKNRLYNCKWCKKCFTNSQMMFRHYNTHKKITTYICRPCKKKFPRFKDFKKHMNVVHIDEPKNPNTAYSFEYNQISKKFYCNVCKENFNSMKIWEEHESIHAKSKMQCKRCQKSFLREANYRYHVKNNLCANWLAEAMVTELKDFKCTICKKEMSNLRNFARHMTNVHGQEDYHCKYCPLNFKSIEKFRSHLVSKHPSEKKYCCNICEAPGFVTFKEFISHLRSHKRKRHIKHVLCKVTRDNLEKRKYVDIKQETQSDEENYTLDVPEMVDLDECGNVKEC